MKNRFYLQNRSTLASTHLFIIRVVLLIFATINYRLEQSTTRHRKTKSMFRADSGRKGAHFLCHRRKYERNDAQEQSKDVQFANNKCTSPSEWSNHPSFSWTFWRSQCKLVKISLLKQKQHLFISKQIERTNALVQSIFFLKLMIESIATLFWLVMLVRAEFVDAIQRPHHTKPYHAIRVLLCYFAWFA